MSKGYERRPVRRILQPAAPGPRAGGRNRAAPPGLDQLWWMVTPGNPLKNHDDLASLDERVALSRRIAPGPRVKVTAFEAAYELHYTAQTLAFVKARNPGINFVWIMGADNLRHFHRWQNWRGIARTFPIAVIDRPGSTLAYLSSKMAKTYSHARIDEDDAAMLPFLRAPAWTFIHGPRSSLSSSAIRSERSRIKSRVLKNMAFRDYLHGALHAR
jgi:nicotinate-nucleotide adenylyltransferase